jgi:hypothetical protein
MNHLTIPLVITLLSGAASADELWRQDHADCTTYPNECYGGPASQDSRNAGGLGWMYEVADNFDADGPWTISNLEFWGAQGSPTPATTDGFMIRFYTDNNGQPGALLSTQDVFSFTQDTYFTWIPAYPIPGFHYTLNLVSPFTVPAPGRYWMAIVAIQSYGGPNDRQWFWNVSSTTHLPYCVQNPAPPNGVYDAQSYDTAFVLYGSRGTSTCYPNCDDSTAPPILNANDFQCFLNKYAANDTYANCDGSTNPPILNANDFQCFLNKFAAGCS